MIQPAKRRLETMVCGPSTSISGTDRLAVLVTANLDVRDCGKCLTQAIPTSTNNRRKRLVCSILARHASFRLVASGLSGLLCCGPIAVPKVANAAF